MVVAVVVVVAAISGVKDIVNGRRRGVSNRIVKSETMVISVRIGQP